MKISDKWFVKKVMCGYCNWGCCNSDTFHIEFTPKEKSYLEKKYNISLNPTESQNGRCRHLNGDDGCSFGEDRPRYCKTYPITKNQNDIHVLSNWSWLHCPKPKDYILDKIEDGKWIYRLKKSHKNKRESLILDDDIEKVIPNFYEREDMKDIIKDGYEN